MTDGYVCCLIQVYAVLCLSCWNIKLICISLLPHETVMDRRMTTSTTSTHIMSLQDGYAPLPTDPACDSFMKLYRAVISSYGVQTSHDDQNGTLIAIRSTLLAYSYYLYGIKQTNYDTHQLCYQHTYKHT